MSIKTNGWVDWIVRVLVLMTFAVAAWGLRKVESVETGLHAIDLRMTTTEADRFTIYDATRELSLRDAAIGELRAKCDALPQETAPVWLTDRLDRMENTLQSLASSMAEISAKQHTHVP